MSHTLVLAHGVFGYGSPSALLPPLDGSLNYFKGVRDHLLLRVPDIREPSVATIGTIEERGEALGDFLDRLTADRIDIIAHSLGGLDARHALRLFPGMAKRVASVVTIGTPHRGSPVAQMILNNVGGIASVARGIFDFDQTALVGLTPMAVDRFNEVTPPAPGVTFATVAGTSSSLLFFPFAHAFGPDEVNDGLVSHTSAHNIGHKHFDWQLNHAEEIGWGSLFFDHPAHLARYDAIVDYILPIPARN